VSLNLIVRRPLQTSVYVLLITLTQVLLMYVGYGHEVWGIRLSPTVAMALFLASPIAAAIGETVVVRRSIANRHVRIAIAVAVTVVATYFGFFFGVNSYGE
jgi:uncharacterized membrane protein